MKVRTDVYLVPVPVVDDLNSPIEFTVESLGHSAQDLIVGGVDSQT